MSTRRSKGEAYAFPATPNYVFELGKLTAEVKNLASEVGKANKRDVESDAAIEKRVEKLEHRGYVQQGAMLVASVVGSAVVQWVIYAGVIRL